MKGSHSEYYNVFWNFTEHWLLRRGSWQLHSVICLSTHVNLNCGNSMDELMCPM
jgi:hypothetical protein